MTGPGFPVSGPGNLSWSTPATEPIVSSEAKQDLRELRKTDKKLAKTLARDITHLLDTPLSLLMKPVRDPPGVGPRYYVDLRQGYVAVFWALDPPAAFPAAGGAVWVERVVLSSVLHAAFDDLARRGDAEPA